MNPEKIIQALLEEFKTMELNEPGKIEQPTSQWTSSILTALCRIGKEQFGYSVHASTNFVDKQYKHGGEWLYDVIWCEYKEEKLKSVPVVGECEWGDVPQIKDDFEKLIQARAAVRVFVFNGGYSENGAEVIANEIRDWVGAFEGTQQGDTYLLVGYESDRKSWWFRYYSILVGDPSRKPVLNRR